MCIGLQDADGWSVWPTGDEINMYGRQCSMAIFLPNSCIRRRFVFTRLEMNLWWFHIPWFVFVLQVFWSICFCGILVGVYGLDVLYCWHLEFAFRFSEGSWGIPGMVLQYFISRSLCREDIDCVWMNEDFGITPYRALSGEDFDCACARYDCAESFGRIGSSSDS